MISNMSKKSKKRFSIIWADKDGVVFCTARSNDISRAIGAAIASATIDHPKTLAVVVWNNELQFQVGSAWPIANNIATFIYEPMRVR